MKLTIILADFAAVADGKLTVVGGGWTLTGPEPTPSAIGLIAEIPWDETNHEFKFRLQLETEDGETELGTEDEPLTVAIEATLEAGRPPGHPKGAPINAPIALVIAPLPLQPASRYCWRVHLDGETHEDWTLPFRTRPA